MELFDFTRVIFEKPGEWTDITPGEKRKHFFMVNRRFAIQHPLQANALQHLKINQVAVMDFWQKYMRKTYSHTPNWMYIKGSKKAKEVKEKKNNNISGALINQYASRMEIDKKAIYEALEYYPDIMQKEIKDFERMITQK
jgi:hypothetical protein